MDELRPAVNWSPMPPVPSPPSWLLPQVAVRGPVYAGFWRRIFAWVLDRIVIALVLILPRMMGNRIMEHVVEMIERRWMVVAIAVCVFVVPFVLVDWLYHAGQESSARRATLGMRALRIVVTDLAGGRISFGRATGRYFAAYFNVVTLGIGYLIQLFTPKRQALPDLVAGTLVVRK